ncbi:MAG: hypothetical protein WDA02_06080 [Saccharofermentanales bacterium]
MKELITYVIVFLISVFFIYLILGDILEGSVRMTVSILLGVFYAILSEILQELKKLNKKQ